MIFRKVNSLVTLTKQVLYQVRTMSPEDYLFNQRECNLALNSMNTKLKPLENSNHGEGTTDEIDLVGVPLGQLKGKYETYDALSGAVERNHPDLLFLQINPAPYLARQRFLSHKCALKEVEDYSKSGIANIDPIKPYTWEECVVNLVVLDMLQRNKVHTDFDYTETLATYSYPALQEKDVTKQLTKPFIESITEHIINKNYSPYYSINKALYSGLLGKHKVLLGDMPEPLLRMQLGNTIDLQEMRDLFKFILSKMKDLKEPISMREATLNFLPHIFQLPKDLYMTALLKESFQAATCIVAMVGLHHINPIQRYWEAPPSGINYSEATRIPERIRGETDEVLIEKQAIMDVMLETRVWGEKYIANPFSYIEEDLTKIQEKDFSLMKKCFYTNWKKYESFKQQLIKELPHLRKYKPELLLTNLQNIKVQEKVAKEANK